MATKKHIPDTIEYKWTITASFYALFSVSDVDNFQGDFFLSKFAKQLERKNLSPPKFP